MHFANISSIYRFRGANQDNDTLSCLSKSRTTSRQVIGGTTIVIQRLGNAISEADAAGEASQGAVLLDDEELAVSDGDAVEQRPRQISMKSGWPSHGKRRTRLSIPSWKNTRPNTQLPASASGRTETCCLRSTTFLRSTGSICGRPIPSSPRSPRFACVTEKPKAAAPGGRAWR